MWKECLVIKFAQYNRLENNEGQSTSFYVYRQ